MPDKVTEIEELVLKTLASTDRMTLMQIADRLPEHLKGCPDEVARALARLRRKGIIAGEFSENDAAWVYWK